MDTQAAMGETSAGTSANGVRNGRLLHMQTVAADECGECNRDRVVVDVECRGGEETFEKVDVDINLLPLGDFIYENLQPQTRRLS